MFSHEYSAWSAILMRLNIVKFHLSVACFAACNITTPLIHFELGFFEFFF